MLNNSIVAGWVIVLSQNFSLLDEFFLLENFHPKIKKLGLKIPLF